MHLFLLFCDYKEDKDRLIVAGDCERVWPAATLALVMVSIFLVNNWKIVWSKSQLLHVYLFHATCVQAYFSRNTCLPLNMTHGFLVLWSLSLIVYGISWITFFILVILFWPETSVAQSFPGSVHLFVIEVLKWRSRQKWRLLSLKAILTYSWQRTKAARK